jgi:hypothetical protein
LQDLSPAEGFLGVKYGWRNRTFEGCSRRCCRPRPLLVPPPPLIACWRPSQPQMVIATLPFWTQNEAPRFEFTASQPHIVHGKLPIEREIRDTNGVQYERQDIEYAWEVRLYSTHVELQLSPRLTFGQLHYLRTTQRGHCPSGC